MILCAILHVIYEYVCIRFFLIASIFFRIVQGMYETSNCESSMDIMVTLIKIRGAKSIQFSHNKLYSGYVGYPIRSVVQPIFSCIVLHIYSLNGIRSICYHVYYPSLIFSFLFFQERNALNLHRFTSNRSSFTFRVKQKQTLNLR